MNLLQLFILAIAVAADAFAVSITLGLTMKRATLKKALVVGLYFGIFQAIMPLLGFFLGVQFAGLVYRYSHWVVFAILAFLGAKLIWGALTAKSCTDRVCTGTPCTDRPCPYNKHIETSLGIKTMLPLAIATSIDALAVGVSFGLLNMAVAPSVGLIGVVTLVISMAGVKVGNMFGLRFKTKAEIIGGVFLIAIGVWTLL